MSLIKPRTRGKQMLHHRTRLDRENRETLYAYAAFIGEEPEYVLNELIDTVLAKDKEFVTWRREHAESFTPRPTPRKREREPRVHRATTLYPSPESRAEPSLILGETHFLRMPGRAPQPTWLSIPQRGLYTGVMILGAVGSGKTSACMYPYVQQLLRWRSQDADKRLA